MKITCQFYFSININSKSMLSKECTCIFYMFFVLKTSLSSFMQVRFFYTYRQCYRFSYRLTRMHSSRMHTSRSLTICCSLLPGGGGLLPGGSGLGGVCSQGCVCSGGGSAPGECLLPGGIRACTETDPPPLCTEFLTHAFENITLAQLRCGR